jgi:RNA polymerase sigma factor (sigma-70 family)
MNMTGDEPREKADSERADLELLAAKEQETFAGRFVECWPHLLRLCRRILGESDAARDAVSETYLRAFRGRVGFDGNNFPGWLSRIAQHVCIDRRRYEFVRQGLDTEIDRAVADSEVRILNALEIRSILAGLPEPQRHCLKLFYIEGFTAKEVATATGFTDKQVKSHLQNGRRNFIRQWKELNKKRHD